MDAVTRSTAFLEDDSSEPLRDRFSDPLSTTRSSTDLQKHESNNVPADLGSDTPMLPLSRRKFTPTSPVIHGLAYGLHAGLVLIHLALLAIYILHIEHLVVVPLGRSSDVLSISVIVISQFFVMVYLTGMVVVTQQLALRRNLTTRQTLTATHDKSAAWSGLGSAVLSLWRQTSVAASVWGVTAVTLYLTCVAVLHISTPSLFSVQTFSTNVQAPVSSSVGSPGANTNFDFAKSSLVLPIYGEFQGLETLGLYGNVLYDVLEDNKGTGNVSVAATTFDVSCGSMSQASQGSESNCTLAGIDNSTLWCIAVTADVYPQQFAISVPIVGQGVIRVPTSYFWDLGLIIQQPSVLPSPNTLLFTALNITDSEGNTGSVVPLDPPMVQRNFTIVNVPGMTPGYGPPVNTTTYAIQVIGCTLSATMHTMLVDAQSKQLVELPQPKTSSTWAVWNQGVPDESYTDSWPTIFNSSADTSQAITWFFNVPISNTSTGLLTYAEQYIMNQLNVTIDPPAVPPQLHDLENAMANLTALMYWASVHLTSDTQQRATTALEPMISSHLNINLTPLATGLAASITLLALAVALIGKRSRSSSVVDTIGVLQMLWLLRDHPEAQERIADVGDPSAQSLREAGMFEVVL